MAQAAVSLEREYSIATLMRRLADKEESEAAELDSAGEGEQAEGLLSRVALARARADVWERDPHELSESDRRALQLLLRDYTMGQDIADKMHEFVARMKGGEQISWEQLQEVFENVSEDHGCEYGIPTPSISCDDGVRQVILARGVPLQQRLEHNLTVPEHQIELMRMGVSVRNSFVKLGDMGYSIIDAPGQKPQLYGKPMAGWRMRKWFDSFSARSSSQLTAEAELKAMETLKGKLNAGQWNCYVLSGAFAERSERSDIHYIFRKGLPTLAMSWHGSYAESGRVLACLCLHPMGYYRDTHAGVMTPTDEVIAHLLFMRADEHGFWRKSGQWPASDTRSGL